MKRPMEVDQQRQLIHDFKRIRLAPNRTSLPVTLPNLLTCHFCEQERMELFTCATCHQVFCARCCRSNE